MIKGARLMRQDRLVALWRLPSGQVVRKGKRVAKSCPLTAEERRAYVEHGATSCCALIMKERGVKLSVAFALLNDARGRLQ